MDFHSSSVLFDGASVSTLSINGDFSSSEEMAFDHSSSFIERYFPVLDELSRHFPANGFFTFITYTITILQSILVSFFVFSKKHWDFSKDFDSRIRYFAYILDFGITDDPFNITSIPLLIITVLAILIVIHFLLFRWYFDINKDFINKFMVSLRFLLSYLSHVCTIPSFIICAQYLSFYTNGGGIVTGIYFAISFIVMLIISYSFFVDISTRSLSLYIERSFFSQWCPLYYSNFIYAHSFAGFSTVFFADYTYWIYCLISTIHMVVCIYFVFKAKYLTFVKYNANVLLASVNIMGSISCLLSHFKANKKIAVLPPLICLIVSFPILKMAFKRYMKSINQDYIPNDQKEFQRALNNLFIYDPAGFSSFRFFSLFEGLTHSSSTWIQLAKLISFFPAESVRLQQILSILTKRCDFSSREWFLYYQIRRVLYLRQGIYSKKVQIEIQKIERQIFKHFGTISSLILEIPTNSSILSIDMMVEISKTNRELNRQILELLEKYPNSHDLASHYSAFLLECCSEIQQGFYWRKIRDMIDSKTLNTVDLCYKHFIRAFPEYYPILRSVNSKINLNLKENKTIGTMHDSIDDNIISSYEKHQSLDLRKAFKRALMNLSITSLQIFLFVSSLCFVIIVALGGYFLVYILGITDDRYQFFHDVEVFSHAREGLEISFFSLVSFFSNISGFNSVFPQESYTENSSYLFHQFEIDPVSSLNRYSYLSISKLLEFLYYYSQSKNVSQEYFLLYNGLVSQNICMNNSAIVKNVTTTSDSISLVSFIIRMVNVGQRVYSDFSWMEDNDVCEIFANYMSLNAYLTRGSNNYLNKTEQISSEFISWIKPVFYYVLPPSVLMVFLPIIIFYYFVQTDFEAMFSVLKKIEREAMLTASKPIMDDTFSRIRINVDSRQNNNSLQNVVFNSLITGFVLFLMMTLLYYYIIIADRNLTNICIWSVISHYRSIVAIESLTSILSSSLVTMKIGYPWNSTFFRFYEDSYNFHSQIKDIHRLLTIDNVRFPACSGFNSELDDLHFKSNAPIERDVPNSSCIYDSLSLEQSIVLYSNYIPIYTQMIKESNGTFTKELIDLVSTLKHMAINHMIPKFIQINNHFDTIWSSSIYQCKIIFTLIVGFAIVSGIYFFYKSYLVYRDVQGAYDISLTVIARFDPHYVNECIPLLNFVLKKPKTKALKLSFNEALVVKSLYSVLILDSMDNIVFMNESCSKLFGKTPEQVIGNSYSDYFDRNSINEISAFKNRSIFTLSQEESSFMVRLHKSTQSEEYTCSAIKFDNNFTTLVIKPEMRTREFADSCLDLKTTLDILKRDLMQSRLGFDGKEDWIDHKYHACVCVINIKGISKKSHEFTHERFYNLMNKFYSLVEDCKNEYEEDNAPIIKLNSCLNSYVAAGVTDEEECLAGYCYRLYNISNDLVDKIDESINEKEGLNIEVKIGLHVSHNITCGLIGEEVRIFHIVGEPITTAESLSKDENRATIMQSNDFQLYFDRYQFIESKIL